MDFSVEKIKEFLEDEIKLREALQKQNDFIMTMYNDVRISEEVKKEYKEKYNELKINKFI